MTQDLPLKNIRVIEMSHMIMGPSCGMILAQLGADVIKIEPPKGDKTRNLKGMGTAFFPLFNRGKRSVVLELDTKQGLTNFHDLLSTADVFIENFRDGMLEKNGIDAASLRKIHPHLIIAGHKGFLSGPYEHRPALDEVVQMMSGLAMMTGSYDKPIRIGSSANDIMGGMFGVIGILAALYEGKARSENQSQLQNETISADQGKEIRIGLFENSLFMVAQHMVQHELTGEPSISMQERRQAWPIYDIFKTHDDQQIFIAVVTDGHWQIFCETYGFDEFLVDKRLQSATDRIAERGWTLPIISKVIENYDLAELSQTLDKLNIPFAEINRPEDMFNNPHVLRNGGLVNTINDDGKTFRSPALPLEIGGKGLGANLEVPQLGAHTQEVLAELSSDLRRSNDKR